MTTLGHGNGIRDEQARLPCKAGDVVTVPALEQACRVRGGILPEDPLIFHSDRGSHYNAVTFSRQLAIHNSEQSMSGVDNCYDNAPMESFWARMKTELISEMMLDDLRHARTAVYQWTHLFDHRNRMHSGTGHPTPV